MEYAHLGDRLCRSAVMKLGRAVRRDNQKWDARAVGLYNCGVQFDGRGPARRDNCRRPPTCEPQPERKEPCSALVQHDVQAQGAGLRGLGEGKYHRGGTRPGRHYCICDASPGPFVHHHGTKAGLHMALAGGAHCGKIIPMASYSAGPTRCENDTEGNGPRPRLVLLHGFTQTGASWAPVVAHLGTCRTSCPDLPGHGSAGAVRAGLWETAEALASTQRERASWAGYSMGGRTALHVALAHPAKVASLVLISTTAGITSKSERRERAAHDDALAGRIEAGGRAGLAQFLEQWLSQPLFAALPREKAGVEARATNTPEGLASSLRLAGAGRQQPLWGRLVELRERELPVLVITGALDQRYCDLGDRLAEEIGPSARRVTIAGAGHACHLEQPAAVAHEIELFAWEHSIE